MSVYGVPIGGATLQGSAISVEDYRRLRLDVNRCLAHIDDVQDSTADISAIESALGGAPAFSRLSNIESSLSTHQSAIDDLDSFVGSSALTLSNVSTEAAAAYNLTVFLNDVVGDQSAFPDSGSNVAVNLSAIASDVSNASAAVSALTSSLSNTDASVAAVVSDLANTDAAIGDTALIPHSNIAVSLTIIEAVADAAIAGLGNTGAYPVPDANLSVNLTFLEDALANTDADVLALTSSLSNTDSNVASLTSSLSNTNANVAAVVSDLSNTDSDLAIVSASLDTLSNTHTAHVGDIANLAIGGDLTAAIGLLDGYIDDRETYTALYELTSTTISGVSTLSGYSQTDGGSGHTYHSNGHVSIGKTGIYSVSLNVYFGGDTADSPPTKRSLYIRNATSSNVIAFITHFTTVDTDGGLCAMGVAPLAASDLIYSQAYTGDAANNNIGNSTYPIRWSIAYLSP